MLEHFLVFGFANAAICDGKSCFRLGPVWAVVHLGNPRFPSALAKVQPSRGCMSQDVAANRFLRVSLSIKIREWIIINDFQILKTKTHAFSWNGIQIEGSTRRDHPQNNLKISRRFMITNCIIFPNYNLSRTQNVIPLISSEVYLKLLIICHQR